MKSSCVDVDLLPDLRLHPSRDSISRFGGVVVSAGTGAAAQHPAGGIIISSPSPRCWKVVSFSLIPSTRIHPAPKTSRSQPRFEKRSRSLILLVFIGFPVFRAAGAYEWTIAVISIHNELVTLNMFFKKFKMNASRRSRVDDDGVS